MSNVNIKKIDKIFKLIMRTFKGWGINIDIEKKEDNPENVKSITIELYSEKKDDE